MGRLTKEHKRALFIAKFLPRLRDVAPGQRVYMRVGDIFKDADVIDLTTRANRAKEFAVVGRKVQSRQIRFIVRYFLNAVNGRADLRCRLKDFFEHVADHFNARRNGPAHIPVNKS
jgi:hypothetical protein